MTDDPDGVVGQFDIYLKHKTDGGRLKFVGYWSEPVDWTLLDLSWTMTTYIVRCEKCEQEFRYDDHDAFALTAKGVELMQQRHEDMKRQWLERFGMSYPNRPSAKDIKPYAT